jgi:hypothetical protein
LEGVLAVLTGGFSRVRLFSPPALDERPFSRGQSSSVLCGVFLDFNASSHLLATV